MQRFSLENFLNGQIARRVRRGLVVITVVGVGGDYYMMRYHHSFDISEAEPYVVDYSPVGRPRPVVHVLPNAHYTVFSPWTPVNGEVVLARRVEGYENWIQTLGGRYIERQTCGVELCTPLETYKAQYLARHRVLPELVYHDTTRLPSFSGIIEKYLPSLQGSLLPNVKTNPLKGICPDATENGQP